MKMGVKEFRDRITEVARGDMPVAITNHGRTLGYFTPVRSVDPERVRAASDAIRRLQDDLRGRGVDLEREMAALGMTPMGEPLDEYSDR